jgi:signal transduction histidine kinase
MKCEPSLVDPILISNFVHQIINPLNGVLGTIDNLIDNTISDPHKRHQRLSALRGQLSHTIEMIRNLAFLSQLQTEEGIKSFREKFQPLNVPSTIIEAIQFFQELAEQKGVKIELTDSKTQYCINGHRNLIKQVFMNIIDNSIKYCTPNTTVSITPRVQQKNNQFIIEIINMGIGFDFDEKEKIFTLGYRANNAGEIKASGSGIGLHICKRIMEEAHCGSIEAEHSNTKKRTIFRLRFPKYYTIEEDDTYGM